nr:hypothetical protein [Microbacterium sp. Leaf179]
MLCEECSQLGGAVVAGGVLLERPPDEGCPRLVDTDRVDEAPVEVPAVIDVAELGAPDGATVLRLVEQLLLNVLSTLTDLNLVHDVRDRFHGFGHVAVAEVFLGGDELHAHAGEDSLGDRRIPRVAEGARAHVNHDVADLGVLFDVLEQFAEHGALGNRLRRVPGLDELFDDGSFHAFGAHQAGLALGGDGVSVGIDVDRGEHLALRRYAQVQDRLTLDTQVKLGRSRPVEAEQALPASERGAAAPLGRAGFEVATHRRDSVSLVAAVLSRCAARRPAGAMCIRRAGSSSCAFRWWFVMVSSFSAHRSGGLSSLIYAHFTS